MKTRNALPAKRHGVMKFLLSLFSAYREILLLEIILKYFCSYFTFAQESQNESSHLLQSLSCGMLGTDSVENFILTG
jgi:hypothetical protein